MQFLYPLTIPDAQFEAALLTLTKKEAFEGAARRCRRLLCGWRNVSMTLLHPAS